MIHTRVGSRRLTKHLISRGLLPDGCCLVEVSMTPNDALIIRYEVMVTGDKLELYADALKAAAIEAMEDDERNRIANEAKV